MILFFLQIEVLTAEVSALKALVITSTPSMPNWHLHPQLEGKKKEPTFVKGHRRSTSHHNFTKEIKSVDFTVTAPEPPKVEKEVSTSSFTSLVKFHVPTLKIIYYIFTERKCMNLDNISHKP